MCSVVSHVRLSAITWTAAHQAPLSMDSPRQIYWSGLPFPPPGNLPNKRTTPESPASPVLEGGFFTIEPSGKPNT